MPKKPATHTIAPDGSCDGCGQRHVRILHIPNGGTRELHTCSGHVTTDRASYVKGQPYRDRKRLDKPRPCGSTRPNDAPPDWRCHVHGGRAPQVKAKRERQQAEAKIAAAARKLIPDADERTPITNPLERLLELASEADAFRESLRQLANKLQDDIRYRGVGSGAEQLRAEVATYRVALKDVTDLLVAIARLDIESTLARITVRQAEQSMAAMQAGMDEAKLDEDQKRKVMAGVGRHLRAVAS